MIDPLDWGLGFVQEVSGKAFCILCESFELLGLDRLGIHGLSVGVFKLLSQVGFALGGVLKLCCRIADVLFGDV